MINVKSSVPCVKKLMFVSVFSVALIVFSALTSAFGAALCGGRTAVLGGVVCDLSPIGGGSGSCYYFGTDKNANGTIEGGSSDVCKMVGPDEKFRDVSCAEACRLNNNCRDAKCPVSASRDLKQVVKEMNVEVKAIRKE